MCLYLNYTVVWQSAARLTRALGTGSYSLHHDSKKGKSIWYELKNWRVYQYNFWINNRIIFIDNNIKRLLYNHFGLIHQSKYWYAWRFDFAFNQGHYARGQNLTID